MSRGWETSQPYWHREARKAMQPEAVPAAEGYIAFFVQGRLVSGEAPPVLSAQVQFLYGP